MSIVFNHRGIGAPTLGMLHAPVLAGLLVFDLVRLAFDMDERAALDVVNPVAVRLKMFGQLNVTHKRREIDFHQACFIGCSVHPAKCFDQRGVGNVGVEGRPRSGRTAPYEQDDQVLRHRLKVFERLLHLAMGPILNPDINLRQ